MKRLFFIFLLFSTGAAAQTLQRNLVLKDAYPPPVVDSFIDIHIIVAQSNGQGRATQTDLALSKNKYLADSIKYRGVKAYILNQYVNPTYFQTLKAGGNTADLSSNTGKWGIQPKLAWELLRHKNKDVYIVQNALGGASISLWRPSGGFLLDSLKNLIDRAALYASSIGKLPRYKSLIFWQYEQDAFLNTDTLTYKSAVRELFSNVRDYVDVANLPVCIIEGLPCQTGGTFNAAYSRLQREISADPNNYLVPAIGSETCADAAHASADTYNLKASQIFNIIKDF